jgi:hypothetical protein
MVANIVSLLYKLNYLNKNLKNYKAFSRGTTPHASRDQQQRFAQSGTCQTTTTTAAASGGTKRSSGLHRGTIRLQGENHNDNHNIITTN